MPTRHKSLQEQQDAFNHRLDQLQRQLQQQQQIFESAIQQALQRQQDIFHNAIQQQQQQQQQFIQDIQHYNIHTTNHTSSDPTNTATCRRTDPRCQ
jgi:hypothetical protein